MFFGKLVGGALGFAFMGPIGGLAGFLLGHWYDQSAGSFADGSREETQAAFFAACFQLMGHVAKADGRVSEDEIAHTEERMRHLGIAGELRDQAIAHFQLGAGPGFRPGDAVSAFSQASRRQPSLRQTLMAFLISLALADGHLHRAETEALRSIAALLGYTAADFQALLQMLEAQHSFHSGAGASAQPQASLREAYAALGVSPNCTDRDLKRAYRRQMSQNHPDKLIAKGVPEHLIKLATERSQEIQAAYERIKKSRPS